MDVLGGCENCSIQYVGRDSRHSQRLLFIHCIIETFIYSLYHRFYYLPHGLAFLCSLRGSIILSPTDIPANTSSKKTRVRILNVLLRVIYLERGNSVCASLFNLLRSYRIFLNLICFVGIYHSAMSFKREIRNSGRFTTSPTSNCEHPGLQCDSSDD